jgi:hypothetical protein
MATIPRTVPVANRTTRRKRPLFEDGRYLTEDGARLSPAEIDFGRVMQRYKTSRRRPNPTYSQVLAVLRSMGYRLTAPASPLPA